MVDGFPKYFADSEVAYEDVRIAQILKYFNVYPYPTVDEAGGERYMHFSAGEHYRFLPQTKGRHW